MIILRVEANSMYYNKILLKLKRIMKNYPIHVDIIQRRGGVYLFSLDDGFSAAFLYYAHLKAKEKGLRASLMYARYIDESFIPKEVRELAKKWLSKKLSKGEVKLLKNINVTEYVMERWCP